MNKKNFYSLLLALLGLSININSQTIRYVKPNGAGDGSSWENAAGVIQNMLNASAVGDQVWVAAGTYYVNTIQTGLAMKQGVNVYGGFFGIETSINSRNKSDLDGNGIIEPWEFTYETIFDGQQTRAVMYQSQNFTVETTWDGITFTNGRTVIGYQDYGGGVRLMENGKIVNSKFLDNYATHRGGGVYNNGGAVSDCLISENVSTNGLGAGIYNNAGGIVSNCKVTENTGDLGGGIYNYNGTINNCIASENVVKTSGGGIYNSGEGIVSNCTVSENKTTIGSSGGGITNVNGTIIDCIISNNMAIASTNYSGNSAYGGGIYNQDKGIVINCTVIGNSTYAEKSNSVNGGGISNSGTLINCIVSGNTVSSSSPSSTNNRGGGIFNNYDGIVLNCLIIGNTTSSTDATAITTGGGVYNYGGTVANCTVTDNTTTGDGAGIYNIDGTIANNIIWKNNDTQIFNTGNNSTIAYNAIQGGFAGDGNIDISDDNINGGPMFVDPDNDNFRLMNNSPCIDAGENLYVTDINTLDLDGNPRIFNGTVDMGAYESQIIPQEPVTISGKVTFNNIPLAGITIENADGYSVFTNDEGEYELTVNKNSDVTITPFLLGYTGYEFTPPFITFINIEDDIDNQNFIADDIIRYVTEDGTGDGTSWENASGNIQAMLDQGGQIWIASGTYQISSTLTMKERVNVYGGFNGNETAVSSRTKSDLDGNGIIEPWEFTSPTIIDGRNLRQVLNQPIEFEIMETFFDGVTLTNGIGGAYIRKNGKLINSVISENESSNYGGIYNDGGTVTDCLISENVTSGSGGGIYNGFYGIITNCKIIDNTAYNGGGIFCRAYGIVDNCIITGNSAAYPDNYAMGGGIHVYFRTPITNCVIHNNIVEGMGGGIYYESTNGNVTNCIISGNIATRPLSATFSVNGGGIYNYGSDVTISNCLVTGNTVETATGSYTPIGSGIYNNGTVTNCTVVSNDDNAGGSGIYNTRNINNSIVWRNTGIQITNSSGNYPSVTYTAVMGGFTGDGNINLTSDNLNGGPMFTNPNNGNFRLSENSPCIDAGNNELIAPDNIVDLDGNPRIWNEIVDMGAYENGSLGVMTENIVETSIVIYPNPTDGKFSVVGANLFVCPDEGSNNIRPIEIFDVSGRNVGAYTIRPIDNGAMVDISFLSAGIYFIRINTDKEMITKKIIKK
ncbi:MAG: T9SS type A sorting domain-containing protein [Marinilabiliaceae bacterium]|nr:T9SS type A sorting domain-containing protein [Marinilabiliaceae bacterium]